MTERVFNLFLFIETPAGAGPEDGLIRSLGAVPHDMTGSDEEKIAALQAAVAADLANARGFPVPPRYKLQRAGGKMQLGVLRYRRVAELMAVGRHLECFEEAFAALGSPPNPLSVVTPVVNGAIAIQTVIKTPEQKTPHSRVADVVDLDPL